MRALIVPCLIVAATGAAAQGGSVVYRCPGPPVEYTDQITAQQARERGCRTIENAPVTIVAPPARPKPVAGTPPPATPRPADAKVDSKEQRERDSDARRILEAELKKEEEALAAMQKDFNNGEPERRGDERNYQKYLDRVESMKADIARKQADIAAIRRELGKLPPVLKPE